MASNANNYLATSLNWTPYRERKFLPLSRHLAFRKDGDIYYARHVKISNGTMLVVDNKFDFDMSDVLEGSEWTDLTFLYSEE